MTALAKLHAAGTGKGEPPAHRLHPRRWGLLTGQATSEERELVQ